MPTSARIILTDVDGVLLGMGTPFHQVDATTIIL